MRWLAVTALLLILSIQNVIAQNAPLLESLPEHLLYLGASTTDVEAEKNRQEQLYTPKRRWEVGQVLKLCFFGGGPSVKLLISELAVTWSRYANLTFDAGEPGKWRDCLARSAGFSHIRVGFSERGHWSAVGTDSETVLGPLQPSMNFEQFDLKYRSDRYPAETVVEMASPYDRGTILHEFGHAIGLLHEHQNPKLNCRDEIKWDGADNVYQLLAGDPNYWSAEKVDRNLGRISLTDPDYAVGDPDPLSIMMYSLDARMFKSDKSPCFVSPNNVLSTKDQEIAAKLYPKLAAAVAENIAPKRPLPAPPTSAPATIQSDYKERIISDLESDQQSVRREARTRLAKYLQTASAAEVSNTITNMRSNTYRYQLGVATALAQSPKLTLEQADLSRLRDALKKTPDPSIREELNRVPGFKK